jgi:hypothetical protein
MKTKKDTEAVRRVRVRQLFEAGPFERTEIGIFKFHGWLHDHRPELLPKRSDDSYQHLKSDLSGLYK